jgi:glucose/arabinose dehydrogenase
MRKRITVRVLVMVALSALVLAPRAAHAQQTGGFDFSQPEVVATGLEIPWGMAFLPDGSALVAERASARVLQVTPGAAPQPVATVPDVAPDGEGGLLGLAAGPDGWVYAYHTSPVDNRIVRFQLDSPATQEEIVTGIPRGTVVHDGGGSSSARTGCCTRRPATPGWATTPRIPAAPPARSSG